MNKILYAIIGVLVVVILLQRSCNSNNKNYTKETTKIDTIIKVHDTIIYKKVSVIKKELKIDTLFLPTKNIDTCTNRLNKINNLFFTKNTYKDTIVFKDKLGSITITDTVYKNELFNNRIYELKLNIPIITKTITQEKQQNRQLYIGANLFGNQNSLRSITPGFIYKTKKDKIYQIAVDIDLNGNINYGIGTYWKIKL